MKIVIPARYEAKRFPGKLCADLDGKPIVQHVMEACEKTNADEVVLAFDDMRIIHALKYPYDSPIFS